MTVAASVCIAATCPALLEAESNKDSAPPATAGATTPSDAAPKPPSKVEVEPLARDSAIQERLLRILKATDWFEDPGVEVRDGVVFLSGTTQTDDYKRWAGDLASSTQDVAAIVNRIQVRQSSIWDLSPARTELRALWTKFIASLPYICIGVAVLVLAWWASRAATATARRISEKRIGAPLLRDVFARTIGVMVLIGGVYSVLHIAGLTRLAVTVVGGTGLLGLVLGIAFHDITENFLASLFLALQRPFEPGDLVKIGDETGFVHRLTTRTTVLMTLDGNQIQLPNSTVYKSAIQNFATNPNRRESFLVGIGYQEDIGVAQSIALQLLKDHPAVLDNPAPWVLVDSLGSAAVNLQVYFWINGREHSWLSVKSSVMRLLKEEFQRNGISIPFEARNALPPPADNNLADGRAHNGSDHRKQPASNGRAVFSEAEGELRSEAPEIHQQAQESRAESERNLLPV